MYFAIIIKVVGNKFHQNLQTRLRPVHVSIKVQRQNLGMIIAEQIEAWARA
jgi:hypothetical protein